MRKTGRKQFGKFKVIINVLVSFFGLFGKRGNAYFLRMARNINGKLGLLLRYVFLKNCCQSIGDNVSVQPNVFLFNLQNIQIGNNVSIHPMCYIEGAGGITIGNDVSIAHASSLISTNHTWDDERIPIKYNKETFSEIIINDDVWIGCGVRILSGVEIKKRSVVAAGAVVNKTFAENSLIGGVPAKLIKNINKN
ncbi:acyltransferase [Flavobacterium sp. NKUCC04_CG]|uniref:acyltransferase n=1 Tax=Flavobacterium sp. NKUCC04_CG TaxID=2842121 RepID=UPI001C5B6ED1|nr:acyltransferase [Flavobacterium sp. NKUCC04_CG]MBW3517562.1 acyltransferase [Flavobacterium sp. NKUCC04_CG]